MLSESLIASVLGSTKTQTSSTLKDVGICIQELQPASALRATFKKSSTPPNGLAVTPTHIFAAQVDKSVIHVYNRLKGNQEATIPFPERIRSLAVAGANGELLILGTEGGRLILWEVCRSGIPPLEKKNTSVTNNAKRLVPDDRFLRALLIFDL